MDFTELLSRFFSGKALLTSDYEEEFVVTSTDKIWNILSNRDCFNCVNLNSVDRPLVVVNTNLFVISNILSGVEIFKRSDWSTFLKQSRFV